ncbi:hypothetical protein ZWY2020_058907 [Hordeum vulgare]|nr:hypothetical protein ZWY2020_058907 [Hordeum vulgare]
MAGGLAVSPSLSTRSVKHVSWRTGSFPGWIQHEDGSCVRMDSRSDPMSEVPSKVTGNFCTDIFQAGSKVVLKTSTYPNKRNVAYGTIRSTDPRTKACGIEVGAEFALVRIDQPLLDNEELVREVSDCKTIGEAFSSGYLIAWPSVFIREKDN